MFPPTVHEGSNFSIPFQYLLLSVFFIITVLVSMKYYFAVVLLCVSLMPNDVEHLSMCLLVIFYVFLKEMSV